LGFYSSKIKCKKKDLKDKNIFLAKSLNIIGKNMMASTSLKKRMKV